GGSRPPRGRVRQRDAGPRRRDARRRPPPPGRAHRRAGAGRPVRGDLGADLRGCRCGRHAALPGLLRGSGARGQRRQRPGPDGPRTQPPGPPPPPQVPGFGPPPRHCRRTDSTNERAKDLAVAGAPGGLVVTADEQSAGRGRRGNDWFAPPGSCLLYSALLRPFEAADAPLLPLAVPVAGCAAAESVAPVRCQVKWPNDVWIDECKVAGILVEARPDEGWAVIGVGLNVAVPPGESPPELRETATSLLPTEAEGGIPAGGAPGVARSLTALNESLGRWVEASDDEVLGAFRTRDALSGRRSAWDGGEGTAEEIDERGHLVVARSDGERVALGAGEVHLAVER